MKEPLITCDACGKWLTEQVWTGKQLLCAECWEAKETGKMQKRCEDHGHILIHIEGTVNGDPLVCAECAYRTALKLSLENDRLRARVADLRMGGYNR